MTTIANAYIDALLADAAYVDLVNEPLDSPTNRRLLGDRMTPTLAAYIAANFEVTSSINTSDIPLLGSGFDATVWRGKVGGDYADQVFVSMRGTEPPPVAAGADLVADGDLALGSAATFAIVDMVNWWLREITPSTELARQIKWDPLHQPNPAAIEIVPSFVEDTRVAGTGHLVGVSNVQVDGHSMGGHMGSECFNSEASDKRCLTFEATADCLQGFATKAIACCAYLWRATGLFFTKAQAANDTSWRMAA